jgi:steroid 5-alpha reductase family enzyme
MKQKYFIDSHKGATAFFVLFLMMIYNQWENPTAWLYLALHGTYGLLWVLKSRIFPDQAWEQKTGWGYGLVIWGGLSLYWIAPWMLTALNIQAPGWYMALCTAIYACGVFFHFASDMQKFTAIKLRPDNLIEDGLFARTRNPNYFGELLIYGGFGLLAMHWLPVIVLLAWVIIYWLPRMRRKDAALARLPGFHEYKRRSRLFIPFIF